MSILDPENDKEEYVRAVRLHMEQLFGADIRSSLISGLNFKKEGSETTYKIDVIRFQAHFQIQLPIRDVKFVDMFMHPESGNPCFCIKGENVFISEVTEFIAPQQLEHLFASLIWGAKLTQKGVEAPITRPAIQ